MSSSSPVTAEAGSEAIPVNMLWLVEAFKGLKANIDGLKANIDGINANIDGIHTNIHDLKAGQVQHQTDMGELKIDMRELKTDMGALKESQDAEFLALHRRLDYVELLSNPARYLRRKLESHGINPQHLVLGSGLHPLSPTPVASTFSFALLRRGLVDGLLECDVEVDTVSYHDTGVSGIKRLQHASAAEVPQHTTRQLLRVAVGATHCIFKAQQLLEANHIPLEVPSSLQDSVCGVIVDNKLFTDPKEKRGDPAKIQQDVSFFVLKAFPENVDFVYDLSELADTPATTPAASRSAEPTTEARPCTTGQGDVKMSFSTPAVGEMGGELPGSPVRLALPLANPQGSSLIQGSSNKGNSTSSPSPFAPSPTPASPSRLSSQREGGPKVDFVAGLSNSVDPCGSQVTIVPSGKGLRHFEYVSQSTEGGNSGTLMLGLTANGNVAGIVGTHSGVRKHSDRVQRGMISPIVKATDSDNYNFFQIEKGSVVANGKLLFQTTRCLSSMYPPSKSSATIVRDEFEEYDTAFQG